MLPLFARKAPVYIKVVRSFFVFYVLLGLYGWFLADSAIFFPPTPTYNNSDQILFINNKSTQLKIATIYLKNPKSSHTILYSHGNAVDLGGLQNVIKKFYNNGYSVLAYGYSGYGLSSGLPSERRTYEDIEAAYHYLVDELNTEPESIIAYGHSLGGAIATNLAYTKPVGGLILESTFVSAFRVRTVWPIYPFDKFNTLDKINSVHAPVLVMHSKDDPIIAFWHSETLFLNANKPKMHHWFKNAGHGGISHTGQPFWTVLAAFVETLNN